MKFSEIKPKTDYIVLSTISDCIVEKDDIIYIDAFGDLIIRNKSAIVFRDKIAEQISTSLEIKEYTDEDYIKNLMSKPHLDFQLSEAADSFKQTALWLAKRFDNRQTNQAQLYVQVSEWLNELKELRHKKEESESIYVSE